MNVAKRDWSKVKDERCECGHLKSERGFKNAFALGHGACEVDGCDCQKFTWKEFVMEA